MGADISAAATARALLWLVLAFGALILLLAVRPVQAQVPTPPCFPVIDADRAYPKYYPVIYRDGQGAGIGWWCLKDDGKWYSVTRFGLYSAIGSDYHARVNAEVAKVHGAADMRAAAIEAHTRLAAGGTYAPCDQQPSDRRALCSAVLAELKKYPPPPAATWTVAPTTFGSRPTYVWDGATRGSTAPERVNVGESCDPAVGSGSYRGVLGRTDRVAFCVEAKP